MVHIRERHKVSGVWLSVIISSLSLTKKDLKSGELVALATSAPPPPT